MHGFIDCFRDRDRDDYDRRDRDRDRDRFVFNAIVANYWQESNIPIFKTCLKLIF